MAVGDFNRDGKQDLAVANEILTMFRFFMGNGNGTFGAATNFAAGDGPRSVAVGDFNGDGRQDLAVANQNSDNVSILLGNGNGTFAAATNFAVGKAPLVVVAGDFNGDGRQDLAVANQNSNMFPFCSSTAFDPSGTFAAATNYAVEDPESVAVGDFNANGRQDLAVANFGSNNVSILLGNGGGTWSLAAAGELCRGEWPARQWRWGISTGMGSRTLAVANQTATMFQFFWAMATAHLGRRRTMPWGRTGVGGGGGFQRGWEAGFGGREC